MTLETAGIALNYVGSIASVVSLAISFYLVWAIRKYDMRFKRLAILPTLNQRLGKCLEEIDKAFNRKSEQKMRIAVARFRSILQHLLEYTDGSMRKEILRHVLLLEELAAKNSENFTFDIGVIRSGLHGVVESCVDFEIKLPWRAPDDG